MTQLKASLSMLSNGGLMLYFFKGVAFTIIIAIFAVVIGFVFGSVLALTRNYCNTGLKRIFKFFAIAYIEIFRNTPLMLWMFICLVSFPVPTVPLSFAKAMALSTTEIGLLMKSVVALVLFTSSVMAEIIRGGLNSVDKGQFEAGYSQGFTFIQVLTLIVMPQAVRAIVPTMLSQIITTIKDTSYIANIAYIEFLGRVFRMIQLAPLYTKQTSQNISDIFVLCGMACVIYFAINFSISILVRSLQKRQRTVKVAYVSE
jgi:aspartate/glutamate/glutamine transport system permease protein